MTDPTRDPRGRPDDDLRALLAHAVDDVDRDDAVDHPVEDGDQPGLPADPLDAEVDVDVLRGDCGEEAQHLVAAEDRAQRRLAHPAAVGDEHDVG